MMNAYHVYICHRYLVKTCCLWLLHTVHFTCGNWVTLSNYEMFRVFRGFMEGAKEFHN